MDYSLAKQLENAGFAVEGGPRRGVWTTRAGGWLDYETEGSVYVPTLSELIEACGDGFRSLANPVGDEWFAESQYPSVKKCGECDQLKNHHDLFHANTPEEAVAKLWLALNKKSR